MKVPKLGNIWINGILVGFRDFITGEFTPETGKENWSLVDDVLCPSSSLVEDEDTGLALMDGDTPDTFVTDGDV